MTLVNEGDGLNGSAEGGNLDGMVLLTPDGARRRAIISAPWSQASFTATSNMQLRWVSALPTLHS